MQGETERNGEFSELPFPWRFVCCPFPTHTAQGGASRGPIRAPYGWASGVTTATETELPTSMVSRVADKKIIISFFLLVPWGRPTSFLRQWKREKQRHSQSSNNTVWKRNQDSGKLIYYAKGKGKKVIKLWNGQVAHYIFILGRGESKTERANE